MPTQEYHTATGGFGRIK
jgi:CheY-like chemotaxis protein